MRDGRAERWKGGSGGGARFILPLLLLLGAPPARLMAQGSAEPHRVVPVVFVPADYEIPLEVVRLSIRALDDVRAWYRDRLGGVTFAAEPFIVQRSRHSFEELAGADFQNWWPLPEREFADYGLPWNRRSRIKLLLLARGAGAWAGADSENGGLDSIPRGGRAPNGALGGLAVIGDSSAAAVLSGVCPRDGPASHRKPTSGTAWWCNWNTYRGTIAHELGHTWGLPHPDHLREGFRCDSTVITNMQCHWAWPADSLLPFEAVHLRSLPGFGAAPDPVMLGSLEPRESRNGVAISSLLDGDSLLWLPGRGGGTGYPWGLTLAADSASTTVTYDLPPDCVAIALEAGRPAGERGAADLTLELDEREVWRGPVPPAVAPRRLRVACTGAKRLRMTASGEGPARIGLGNPRIIVGR